MHVKKSHGVTTIYICLLQLWHGAWYADPLHVQPMPFLDTMSEKKAATPRMSCALTCPTCALPLFSAMQVHRLLEASADAAAKKDVGGALEKAKDAGKKERALCRHRETNGLSDHINLDLTYAVCLNLAYCYHLNHMHDEVRQGR